MQVVHVVAASGCGCWHCQRIAELVNVCLVLRQNVARLENDLKIEREGTAMLLAENKRHAASALDLACQLDQQRADYWRATEANTERDE